MNSAKTNFRPWMLATILAGTFVAIIIWNSPAIGHGLQKDATTSHRYTINHTEGTNLIVTDNQTNTVYFYTIEPDGKPGDDLILRGSADLTQVGKPVIKPTLINPRK